MLENNGFDFPHSAGILRRIQQPVKQQERADSALVFALGFRRPNASAVCQRFPQRKSLLEEGRSEAEMQPKSLFREGEKEKKRFPSCHKGFRLLLSRTEAISIPRNRQNHMGGRGEYDTNAAIIYADVHGSSPPDFHCSKDPCMNTPRKRPVVYQSHYCLFRLAGPLQDLKQLFSLLPGPFF